MKKKYVFIWVLSSGRWDAKNNRMNFEDKYPITACGSDSVIPIDGRLSLRSMIEQARELTKKRGGVGFSIGRLEPHDPENQYCQCIVKFTKI
jgi:hypothetical protein